MIALQESPADALAAALRVHARSRSEAVAVEVIALHGTWLHNPEFRQRVVWVHPETGVPRLRMIVLADVAGERRQPLGNPTDQTVLRAACSLAGILPTSAVGKSWTMGAQLADLQGDPVAVQAVTTAFLGLAQGRWS